MNEFLLLGCFLLLVFLFSFPVLFALFRNLLQSERLDLILYQIFILLNCVFLQIFQILIDIHWLAIQLLNNFLEQLEGLGELWVQPINLAFVLSVLGSHMLH